MPLTTPHIPCRHRTNAQSCLQRQASSSASCQQNLAGPRILSRRPSWRSNSDACCLTLLSLSTSSSSRLSVHTLHPPLSFRTLSFTHLRISGGDSAFFVDIVNIRQLPPSKSVLQHSTKLHSFRGNTANTSLFLPRLPSFLLSTTKAPGLRYVKRILSMTSSHTSHGASSPYMFMADCNIRNPFPCSQAVHNLSLARHAVRSEQ